MKLEGWSHAVESFHFSSTVFLSKFANVYRQGVLPYPKFWTYTKPFGTPLGPYVFIWTTTLIMILAPPAGDAFNFGMLTHNYVSHIQLTSRDSGGSCCLPWKCVQLTSSGWFGLHSATP